MPGEALIALAQWAGQTVVSAADTDLWEVLQGRLARLLGGGDALKSQVAEERLAETRRALTAPGPDPGARDVLAELWAARFADLLDEDPGIASELRALMSVTPEN